MQHGEGSLIEPATLFLIKRQSAIFDTSFGTRTAIGGQETKSFILSSLLCYANNDLAYLFRKNPI